MRILIHSNSPAIGTGYGMQTRLFAPRLKRAGHDVTISAFFGREGAAGVNEDGIMELPRVGDAYGNDVVAAHAEFCSADIVLSLIDPFALDPVVWGDLPWAAWVPVDCAPVLPETASVVRHARHVIAMSRFGREQLRAAGFKRVHYVPMAVDMRQFQPGDRLAARVRMSQYLNRDVGDAFLVVSVAANKGMPSRKNFDGMLAAFSAFAADHPDALLYLHSETLGLWNGEDLRALVRAYGVEDRVLFPPQYPLLTGMIGPDLLNIAYNAADVFLLLSRGEGFGVPLIEAQAAGCPVIVTDFSAMPELVFAGRCVPGLPFMAANGYWQRLALTPAAVEALAWAYQRRGDTDLRRQAREGALAYDVDRVMKQYMLPALRRMGG